MAIRRGTTSGDPRAGHGYGMVAVVGKSTLREEGFLEPGPDVVRQRGHGFLAWGS